MPVGSRETTPTCAARGNEEISHSLNTSRRRITESPRVLLDGAVRNTGHDTRCAPAFARRQCASKLLALGGAQRRPTEPLALGAGPLESGLCPFADLRPLKLGERGEDGEQHVTHQFVVRRQMRLA